MRQQIEISVNGHRRSAQIDARLLLIEVVRDHFDLKGTRIGCLTGDCGACTLFLDGRLTKSCLVLALSAQGREIVTVEGLSSIEPLQRAFVATNAFQCGFCTTGMLLAAADLLRSNSQPTDDEIRRAISGNLCRCTGYEDIVSAIRKAADDARVNA